MLGRVPCEHVESAAVFAARAADNESRVHLLEALQGHQDELDSPGCAGMPLAKLVLSQFRWLEHVADGSGALARVRRTRAYHRPALQPAVSHASKGGEKNLLPTRSTD